MKFSDRINLPALWVLAFAVCMLACCVRDARASQTRTFYITKPTGYADGTPFGTEQLVYLVFNADDGKQLFSTQTLVTTRTDIPDGAKCFFVKPAILNVTADNVLPGTLGDASPSSCPKNPPAKKVAATVLTVQ